ncbi:heterokaryon incompatibility protein-domain-containing protein [Diaporthe sp. PMI_573]|nr:heterokaryon incompatibility protein-domain-containing protein [Diaporthaceae sp. PMI_573]
MRYNFRILVVTDTNLFEDPGDDSSEPTDNWPQIGLPRLPPVGSEAHFTILRDWLEECDEQHEDCQPVKGASFRLPTRLIDVGATGGTEVRLYETKDGDTFEYLALSHPWGPDRSSHFCTYPENLGHYLQRIPLEDLPQTFQDAVEVTRSLKHQYLWIDSICIIQGPRGDFNEQAKHMEGIFRHAYCVLAASCAMDQQDGFLKPRDERRCLKLHQNLPGRLPIYACEFIDNFQQHALDSHLNKRGWVLQERALARRTIFFTEKQTYWECGAGVRCETSMTMNNKLASFLGDSRFPEIGMRSTHGSKILLFQDLYSKYSRLELSHDTDRPVAIAGIEKHLISSFEVRGGFGVLDDGDRGLLWRSLLWQRGHDAANELKRIDFQSPKVGTAVIISPPSWSWMAYKGAIDYLDLPFDGVDWEEDDIRFRWLSGTGNSWSYSGDCLACPLELTVCGRSFDLRAARASDSASIMLDDPDRTDELEPFLKCVVLGRSKGQAQDSSDARAHYVLLVTPSEPPGGGSSPIYNRAGVGYVPGALIDFTEQVVPGELR